mgnify:CR=1 FL=1
MGIEQEYTLIEKDGNTPLGFFGFGYPGQGPKYYGAGLEYNACWYAGTKIAGITKPT